MININNKIYRIDNIIHGGHSSLKGVLYMRKCLPKINNFATVHDAIHENININFLETNHGG